MCVATVGSFVDWKKEVQFVISRAKSDEKNIVSQLSIWIARKEKEPSSKSNSRIQKFYLNFFNALNVNQLIQCRVLRNGKVETIHHNYLHVGDVINVEYGMANPVDGIIYQATQLAADESAMTGESDEMKKETLFFCKQRRDEKNAENPKGDENNKMSRSHEISSPLILSGTSIAGGEGKMICLMVG